MILIVGPVVEEITQLILASRWRRPMLKQLLRFDNWLDRWVSTLAMEQGLHPKHRLMDYHQFFVSMVTDHDTVLDVGCGNGFVAYDVAGKARSVVGIDFDKASIATAQRRYQRRNLRFIHGDATTHVFGESFTVVILSNVLEHIDDRVGLLVKLSRLAPKIIIRVPMIDRDWQTALKKEMGVEWRLDPTHTIEYTEAGLRQEVAAAGLHIVSLHIRYGEIFCVALEGVY